MVTTHNFGSPAHRPCRGLWLLDVAVHHGTRITGARCNVEHNRPARSNDGLKGYGRYLQWYDFLVNIGHSDCPFQRSFGHVTCSVIPSGVVSIDNYTDFKSGCFGVFVFLLLGLNNFEIQLPDPSTDPSDLATTRFMKYHVQVQQQLLYDFMISSAFPFLALNFTPVSMACHRHTCQPCPCRHTGLASGRMVWAGLSISSWSSLIRVCYECHDHVGFSTSPKDFLHAVSPPTFPRGNQQSSFFEV